MLPTGERTLFACRIIVEMHAYTVCCPWQVCQVFLSYHPRPSKCRALRSVEACLYDQTDDVQSAGSAPEHLSGWTICATQRRPSIRRWLGCCVRLVLRRKTR